MAYSELTLSLLLRSPAKLSIHLCITILHADNSLRRLSESGARTELRAQETPFYKYHVSIFYIVLYSFYIISV
jgi:hypothetical protein